MASLLDVLYMNYKAMNTNNGSRLSFVPAHFAARFSERYPQS